MEDPSKRKERLQAMRTEATQINASAETSMNPSHLLNPLAETSSTLPSQEESFQSQRFDYYTDPMSAFSSNKRNKTDLRIEQHHSSSPSNAMDSPVSQFRPSLPGPMGTAYQAHNTQGGFQAQGHYDSTLIGPRGMVHPTPLYHGTPQGWNEFRPPTHNFRSFQGPRPVAVQSPYYQGTPVPGDRFVGRGNYNRPPNHTSAPMFFNHGQQNANWAERTGPGSGRGRAGRHNMTTSFGRNGGRQQNYDRAGYQAPGPERFYNNSMVEDPWKYLEPVLWKSCTDASSSCSTGQAWLPKSIAMKNSTVSEASKKSNNNRQSLAEYLAASLDEAICNEPNN